MPRWLKLVLGVLLLLGVVILSLPWWASAAAKPILASRGITLVNSRAKSFRTMQIDEVRFARGNTTAVVQNVEIPSPLFWMRNSGRRASAGTWSVVIKAADTPTPAGRSSITGLPSLHAQLLKIARALGRWLPDARVGAGEVRWPQGNVTLAAATWEKSVFAGQEFRYLDQTFDLTLDASRGGELLVSAQQPAREATATLHWRGAKVTGAATVWTQTIPIEATFPVTGWLPEAATARAENWDLPAERFGLGRYYDRLKGDGTLAWQQQNFTAALHAEATPKDGLKSPPFKAALEAKGDLRGITISALQVDAPFARATLDAPITIPWRGRTGRPAARLTVAADLAEQTFFAAKGRLHGSITATSDGRQEFSWEIEGAHFGGVALERASARGHWDGRQLVVQKLDAELDQTTRAQAAGVLDWETRNWVNVTLEANAAASALSRWLPPGAKWTQASLKGTINGPIAKPDHTGEIRVTGVQVGPLKPSDFTATWRGAGAAAETFSAALTAGKSTLQISGRSDARAVTLHEIVFAPAGIEQLTLVDPVRVEWSPTWRGAARFQGPRGALGIDVNTGPAANFQISATHLDKEWIHDWLDLRGPTWRVQRLDLAGRTSGEVIDFTAALHGEIHLPGREVAQVELAAAGDRAGVRLTELTVAEAGALVTRASGRIAATWQPAASPRLTLDEQAPLEIHAEVQPASPLWAALGEPMGITMTGASARAELKGTLAQPMGDLQVAMETLQMEAGSRWRERVPDVTGLTLAASGDRTGLRLDAFKASIEGQEIRGRARVPMDKGEWRQLLTEPRKFNWRDVEARVEVPGADLAALARRLPAFFAARGTLQAAVELAAGGRLSGSLSLRDAATRPLPALGVIQEITAEVSIANRTARIDSFTGLLGGEPVQLQGSVELPLDATPRPNLQLTGKNLPLVRKAGLLVRSDLDLQARTEGNRTRITGDVTLRDGLLLADLSDLLPTGVRGTKRRPPYFSVTTEPFNRWGLDVEIRGASAVRMRTPFFTGSGSANFMLSGNLGEPRAVGEITVEEGRIFFPFATFTLENGAVRLRAADPYHPELAVNAISRRNNYELHLEATGAPEDPVLVFSSNPALEAGQVLAMVMAGQVPANESNGTTAQGGLRLTQLGAYLGQSIYRGLGGTDENRLEIVAGERISRQGRETYEVEYKLGERWSVVGEYDEFDSYNAGLKWRVYKQEGDREKK